MKIRHKLGLTTLGLTLIVMAMFLVTWWVTGQQKNDGLVVNLAGRQRMLTQKMTKELLFLQSSRKESNIDPETLATSVRSTMAVFDKTLLALKDSGDAPLSLDLKTTEYRYCPRAQEPAYSKLMEVATLWKDFSAHMDTVLQNGEEAQTHVDWVVKNNMPLLKAMNAVVLMMQKQSEARVTRLLLVQIICVIAGLAASVLATVTIISIVKRLDRVKDFAARLGDGDLAATSELTGQDELGSIGVNLDAMAGNLQEMFTKISDSAANLNNSSTGLAEISTQMSQGAEDVSGRSHTVAVAAEEMSSNMNSVAAAMEQASTNVGLVSTAAEQMTTTIDEISHNTVQATNVTRQAVGEGQDISAKVHELGSAAEEIGKVTETIAEISEQTNLLALNATIEAARAGEAGKGFAVVANEIKELANQTAGATEEIRVKIDGIQNSTVETVKDIQQITKVIGEVDDIVSTIASAVEEQLSTTKEIANNVSQASLGIQEVNENVAQTSAVAGEIARDISQVNQSSTDMSDGSARVSSNALELSSLSEQLTEIVGSFARKEPEETSLR